MAFASRWLKSRSASGGQTRTDTRLTADIGAPTGPLTVRSGVVPGGDPFALSGTGMVPTIGPGRAVVQGGGALQGAYPVAVTISESMPAFPDGSGANPRVDLIVLRVYDPDFDAVPTAQVVLERVAGTPNPVPVAPDVPPGALALWEIPVAANASAANPINWASRVDRRMYATAVGGIGAGPNGAGAYVGQWRDTGSGLQRWDGTSWTNRLVLEVGGRLVIGADTEWIRDAADRWRTPDSVVIDGSLTVGGVGQRRRGRVATDQSLPNTTLTDAAGMSFSVVAGGEYVVTGRLGGSGSTTGDLKIGWSGPGGASTFDWVPNMQPSSATATVGTVISDRSGIGQSQIMGTIGTGTIMTAGIDGYLVAAVAGTFKLQVAQGTLDAGTPSVLKAGSYLMVERVA